ncbi:MAG: stalk domain-containing protein [Cellulosilyticaceae bacterium]
MNKKMQKISAAGLAVLVGSGLFVTNVDAASLTKSMKAIYNNIKVTFDGQSVTPNMEPFMVDGTVYVSLRDAGQITGNQVEWSNNTVHIKPGAGSVDQSALDAKQREVDFWKVKAEALEKQLNDLKAQGGGNNNGGVVVKPGDTAALEKHLVETFDETRYVAWDFDIKQHSSKNIVYVTVSYDSKSDRKDFENMTEKQRNTFLTDVCEEIVKSFKDYAIEGTLEDENKGDVKGTFTYSTKGKYSFNKTLTDSDLRDIASDVKSTFGTLPALDLGGDKSTYLPIEKIDLSLRDGVLTYRINVDIKSEQQDAWNKLNDYDFEDTMVDFLDDIEDELSDEISFDEINGYIYSGSKQVIKYEEQEFNKRNF